MKKRTTQKGNTVRMLRKGQLKGRKDYGGIHIVKNLICPNCTGTKAWNKAKGLFCTKCGVEIEQ